METNKILSADILDLLFEGKNKEYGAYELRKTYNKRIGMALIITAAIALMIFVGSVIAKNISDNNTKPVEIKDVTLEEVKPEDKPKPPPPPPPKLPPPPPIKTIQFTPPKIVKDQEVVKPPVENEKIEEAKVDVKTQAGAKDVGIVAPPVEEKSQVVEAPKKVEEDADKVFTKVEIEARFPGGEGAWTRYVTKAITNNIDELTEAGESGTVHVKFIVNKQGVVSDVEALDKKGSKLAEVAINAIRKGPNWVPAQQNGRQVNAYRIQPITFTIQDQ
ncbi:MAG: energy transducer TonB [Bacteroidota bacterium]|nr:energy transducer TonB [Bacteroidota bacterium]